jgi:aconitate hydratase
MGVLPLQFTGGDNAASLGLSGHETFTIGGIAAGGSVPRELTVKADAKSFTVTVRIDTPGEQAYYRNGGIMPFVLRSLL